MLCKRLLWQLSWDEFVSIVPGGTTGKLALLLAPVEEVGGGGSDVAAGDGAALTTFAATSELPPEQNEAQG